MLFCCQLDGNLPLTLRAQMLDLTPRLTAELASMDLWDGALRTHADPAQQLLLDALRFAPGPASPQTANRHRPMVYA